MKRKGAFPTHQDNDEFQRRAPDWKPHRNSLSRFTPHPLRVIGGGWHGRKGGVGERLNGFRDGWEDCGRGDVGNDGEMVMS